MKENLDIDPSFYCIYNHKKLNDDDAKYLLENEFYYTKNDLLIFKDFCSSSDKKYNEKRTGKIQFKRQGEHRYSDPNKENYGRDIKNFQVELHVCANIFEKYSSSPHQSLGRAISYQIPICRRRIFPNFCECKLGKIDLMMQKDDVLYLIEVKAKPRTKSNPPDSFLRCVLEIEAYYYSIDLERLVKEFQDPQMYNKLPVKPSSIRRAIMIYENSLAHRDFISIQDIQNKNFKFTREFLAYHEDVEVIIMENEPKYEHYRVKQHTSIREMLKKV